MLILIFHYNVHLQQHQQQKKQNEKIIMGSRYSLVNNKYLCLLLVNCSSPKQLIENIYFVSLSIVFTKQYDNIIYENEKGK